MTKYGEIREEVAAILTALFCDEEQVFMPEHTIKRTGGGRRKKSELKTTTSWSAEAMGPNPILVTCVGMTMKEFIENYKTENLYILEDNRGIRQISIYSNSPSWRTRGYVEDVDQATGNLVLHIQDLWNPVTLPISSEVPKWLLEGGDSIVCFTCRVHQGWRSLKNYEELDWSKIWRTFKFDRYIRQDEKEDFALS